jgi:hypothetical protein
MNAIIRPTDFNRNTADPNRNTWNTGQLRHIMHAIDAIPHAKTLVETVDGLLQPYQIVGLVEGGGGRYARVTLRHFWTENGVEKHQDTRFPLFDIGAVIVLNLTAMDDPRHKAMDSYRNEASALVSKAQELHGECEGRKWGSWNATPGAYDGMGWVTYEPSTGGTANTELAGTRWYGNVSVNPPAKA